MNSNVSDAWGTDTPISMPVPPEKGVLVDMGSYVFTRGGLAHNLNHVDWENYLPVYLPSPEGDK